MEDVTLLELLESLKILGFNYIAMDEDLTIQAYENKPVQIKDCFGRRFYDGTPINNTLLGDNVISINGKGLEYEKYIKKLCLYDIGELIWNIKNQ